MPTRSLAKCTVAGGLVWRNGRSGIEATECKLLRKMLMKPGFLVVSAAAAPLTARALGGPPPEVVVQSGQRPGS